MYFKRYLIFDSKVILIFVMFDLLIFSCRLAGKLWLSILLLSLLLSLLSLDNVYPLASYECEWHNSFDQSYMLDLVQTFSNLFQCNQTCSKLFKVVQSCSNFLKLVQTCSKLLYFVRTCSNIFKHVLINHTSFNFFELLPA